MLFSVQISRGQFTLRAEDKALEALEAGDKQRAEELARNIINRNPQNADAYYVLARVQYDRDEYDKAINNFNKAVQNDNSNAEFYFWRGKTNYQLDRNIMAQADFDRAIDFDKSKADYYFFRGLLKSYNDLPEDAILDYNQAISLQSNNDAYYYQRASSYFSLGNFAEALKDIELAIAINKDPDYLIVRGLCYFQTGKFIEAQKDLKDYIELNPNEEDAYYFLAKIKVQENFKEEAKQYFKKYLELTNVASPRLQDTYETLQYHEFYDLAIECAQIKYQNNPTWDYFYDVAYFKLQLGQLDDALKDYKKAISFAPEQYRWEVYNLSAWDLSNYKEVSESILNVAEEWAQISIQLNENFSNNETYAYILYKKERYQDAYYKAERAIDLAKKSNIRPEFSAQLMVRIKGKLQDTQIAQRPSNKPVNNTVRSSSGPRIPFTIYGVVIGVSRYKYSKINLEYADDDAEIFYKHLISANGGAEPENVTLLLNEKATRENVLKALYGVSKHAMDDDLIYIYIASHGMPSSMANELYFLGYNTDPNNIEGTGISKFDIERAFMSSRANKKIWIADACHSGGVGLSTYGSRGLNDQARSVQVARLLNESSKQNNSVILLSASSAGQQSLEGKQWGGGHGVFTYYLVKGLKGEADADGNRFVQVRELFEYIRENVSRDTKDRQYPELKGQYKDKFPLSVIR
jgi:tetratricopeptide (TPR) repeat protein